MPPIPTPAEAAVNGAEFMRRLCLDHADEPNDIPKTLTAMGFRETQRLADGVNLSVWSVLMELDDGDFSVVYLVDLEGNVDTLCALFPDSREAKSALTDFVKSQPKTTDITRDITPFLHGLPDALATCMRRGKFWSSKAVGEMGMNFGVMPFPVTRADGNQSLAFTVEPNRALEDRLTYVETQALFDPTSRFERYMEIFETVGIKHGDDFPALVTAAQAQGFDAEIGDTTGSWMGGGRDDLPITENLLSFQLNNEAETDFELALFFRMDARLIKSRIKSECLKRLGITQTNDAGHGQIMIRDELYGVTLGAESELFGNYYLMLYK